MTRSPYTRQIQNRNYLSAVGFKFWKFLSLETPLTFLQFQWGMQYNQHI